MPYRTPGEQKELPPPPALCCKACGCPNEEHYFFNSEFVECLGKGRPKAPPPPKAYPDANCKCEGLR